MNSVVVDTRTRRTLWRVGLNAVLSATLVGIGIVTAPLLLIGLAVAAAIGLSAEVVAPLHGGRRSARSYVTDLTHAVGNRILIVPVVALAVSVLAPVTAWLVPSAVRDGFAALPTLAQVAVALVVTDFANYVTHYGLHRVGFLWSFHAVHHSSERLDWLATSRGHPLDLAFNLTAISLPSAALGRVELAPWLLTFFFLYPFVCHANARIRIPGIGRILVTPEFHHWHHAADTSAYDKNFGSIFSIWDRLFHTAVEPGEFPVGYGIDDREIDAADYLGQLAAPFRRPAARADQVAGA